MDIAPSLNSGQRSAPPLAPLRWGPWATIAWGACIALTAILLQSLAALGFVLLWRLVRPDDPIAPAQIAANGGVLSFALAVSAPPVLALLAYAVHRSGRPFADYLGLRGPRVRDVGVGFASVLAVLLISGLLAALTGQEVPDFITATYRTARQAGMLPLVFVSFVILAPLQEELLFRGFFYRGFASAWGRWPAIVATSAAWAITHVQYEWFFVGEIFALGMVLGWLRAKSHSTTLTFLLHAVINGLALLQAAALA